MPRSRSRSPRRPPARSSTTLRKGSTTSERRGRPGASSVWHDMEAAVRVSQGGLALARIVDGRALHPFGGAASRLRMASSRTRRPARPVTAGTGCWFPCAPLRSGPSFHSSTHRQPRRLERTEDTRAERRTVLPVRHSPGTPRTSPTGRATSLHTRRSEDLTPRTRAPRRPSQCSCLPERSPRAGCLEQDAHRTQPRRPTRPYERTSPTKPSRRSCEGHERPDSNAGSRHYP